MRSSSISSQARFSLEWSRGSGGFGCVNSDSNAERVGTGAEYASALLHLDPITLKDESDVTYGLDIVVIVAFELQEEALLDERFLVG